MIEEADPLVYLPMERWAELQSTFKADWPRGISGYAALEVQRRWKQQGIDYEFKVYCPFGDVSNGMVAVNVKDEFYEIVIQCPKDDTKQLEEALRRTKIIDWSKEVCVPYATHNVIECLQRTIPALNVKLLEVPNLHTFVLEKDIFDDVTVPPNISFRHITGCQDINLFNSTWPHRYPNSEWYFKLLINTNHGYGLYHKNEPICWVFFRETGALHHLYTVEGQRGKGYAELLLKLISKIWLKSGIPVFAFCFKDNLNACRLYRRMGFVTTETVSWCFFNKVL